jgi:hypothetical protein
VIVPYSTQAGALERSSDGQEAIFTSCGLIPSLQFYNNRDVFPDPSQDLRKISL